MTPCRSQQGFTLLEGIIALSVLTSLLVLGNYYTRQRLEESLQQQAAAHLRLVTAAAVRYAQDRYDPLGSVEELDKWRDSQQQLQKDQDSISLEVWRYQDLIKEKYLPELTQQSERNLYGQGYALYIIKVEAPTPRKQLLVLTTGGKKLSERELRSIARQAGGQGGSISKQDPNNVIGSQQGWQLQLPAETRYQPSPEPNNEEPQYETPGHLACLHTLYPDDLLRTSQLLHRTAQHGQPELNQMETDLKMQHHQIIFTRENTEIIGSLSTQGLQFKPDPQHQIDFGYDSHAERVHLDLKDAQGSVIMDAEHVTTTGLPTVGTVVMKGYSAPELNAYWNKVPYYEIRTNQSPPPEGLKERTANWLCSKESKSNETAFGRLFMLGHQKSQATFLYLCGHGPTKDSATAHLISQFPPEAGQARP